MCSDFGALAARVSGENHNVKIDWIAECERRDILLIDCVDAVGMV